MRELRGQTEVNSHIKWLRQAAKEIASEGHNGWGNTCTEAADEIDRLSTIESIEKGTAKALLDALKEVETLSTEVSNLKLANGEARKTIDRLNALIPREPNSGGDPISSIQEKDDG